jgi:mRNA interferase MazF
MRIVNRGEVYYADLGVGKGSEQGGLRPVVVIQNNIGNKFSPTVIVAPVSSKVGKVRLPTHVRIKWNEGKCNLPSFLMLEQIRVIDKSRLTERVCQLSDMTLIDEAIKVSLAVS